MVKVYVNYVKWKNEKEPNLKVSIRKSDADNYREAVKDISKRRPGTIIANKMRMIDFWLIGDKKWEIYIRTV